MTVLSIEGILAGGYAEVEIILNTMCHIPGKPHEVQIDSHLMFIKVLLEK